MPSGYRLCKAAYAPSTPDAARTAGAGAARNGSRWNSKGTQAVYCSTSIALAILEVLVHTPVLPAEYQCWKVELPSSLLLNVIRLEDLADGWRVSLPYPASIQALGDTCLSNSPAVVVPSAVVIQEQNFILNPVHPDYPAEHWEQVKSFDFDPRLPWT
jgi:RES domain-containing protein